SRELGTLICPDRPAAEGPVFEVLVSLSEFGCAQTRSTLGSRGQRSTVCARSFHIETWPRSPCTTGTKSTAATLARKKLPSFSFRGAFGCGGRRRVRRGA